MAENIEPLERLTDMFRKLDGVGKKSAARYAFCVLNFTESEAYDFAQAIISAKTEIKKCSVCCNITTHTVCDICDSDTRDHSTVCVVEDPRAVLAIENCLLGEGAVYDNPIALAPIYGVCIIHLTAKRCSCRLGEYGQFGYAATCCNILVVDVGCATNHQQCKSSNCE